MNIEILPIETESALSTVSGNSAEPQNPPIVETSTETTGETIVNNYTIDTTQLETLLNAILEEEKRGNENIETLLQNLATYHEDYLQNSLHNQMELADITEKTVSGNDVETEYRENVISFLETIEGYNKLTSESLETINETVSGNSITLDSINTTMETLATSYEENIETATENNSAVLGLLVSIGFILAMIAGFIITNLTWGKKHE